MYTRPLAYFLTWHTYGTWLHGHRDGSVDKHHDQYGSDRVRPKPMREARARERMKSEPVIFSKRARSIVEAVIREHCALKNWHLHALAVRTNHVHVVVGAGEVEPEPIVKQLKQWGTRRLREGGLVASEQPVWAKHASTKRLFDERSLHQAVRYTLEEQERVRV